MNEQRKLHYKIVVAFEELHWSHFIKCMFCKSTKTHALQQTSANQTNFFAYTMNTFVILNQTQTVIIIFKCFI